VAGVNYREQPQWAGAVKELTGGRGVDLVVEVGGAETLPQSVRALRVGGQVSLIGNLTGGSLELSIIPIFMRHLRIQGILVGHREGFEAMARAVAAHEMRPVVDRVFELVDSRQAFEHLARGGHFGKICVRL
jgi:NADPH:quinone reductase-like Zn-dependent oxidoreductase